MQQPDSKVQEKRYDVRRKNCKRISEIFSFNDGNKQNIFAHSDEIEVRKQIKNELYEFIGTLNEEQKEILSVQSSLIESVYRYRSDFYSADDDISCQDFLNGWIKSVMS